MRSRRSRRHEPEVTPPRGILRVYLKADSPIGHVVAQQLLTDSSFDEEVTIDDIVYAAGRETDEDSIRGLYVRFYHGLHSPVARRAIGHLVHNIPARRSIRSVFFCCDEVLTIGSQPRDYNCRHAVKNARQLWASGDTKVMVIGGVLHVADGDGLLERIANLNRNWQLSTLLDYLSVPKRKQQHILRQCNM